MRTIFVLLIIFTMPALALSQKVAVIPSSYTFADTGLESIDASRQVHEQVIAGVQDANREPVDETEVKQAMAAVTGSETGKCRDRDCLAQVASRVNADEAVYVSITEIDEWEREVVVMLALIDGVTERREDGFMVVLKDVRRLVALAIQRSSAAIKNAPVVEWPEPDGAVQRAEPKEVAPPPQPVQEVKEGLSPVTFYLSAGLTGAAVISWIVIDSFVYYRSKELEGDRKDDDDYRDDTKALQVADWAVLGTAAAGLVTTTVLFFFTDFNHNENNKTPARAELGCAPILFDGGGMVAVSGRF